MKVLVCADAGTVCPAVLSAHTAEELRRRIADHMSRDHKVGAPNQTILNYMTSLAREGVEQ